jgi:CRISPR-associated endonuclease/helicase Cas3
MDNNAMNTRTTRIFTQALYSKLANPAEVAKIPALQTLLARPGWQLSQHQLDTYLAVTSRQYDIVFNTAMTGDGKSLAGQLPLFAHWESGWTQIALYPTNELITDQGKGFAKNQAAFGSQIYAHPLNSGELDRLLEENDFERRGNALQSLVKNYDFLFSNPDIFYYVFSQFYTYPKESPVRYVLPFADKFNLFIFDEFHIFDAPQIVSVLNALLFIKTIESPSQPKCFLFLSATPSLLMQEYLAKSQLRTAIIQGEYRHSPEPGWRKILNASEIQFSTAQKVEDWLENGLQAVVIPFFQKLGKGAKGAIIVNSVATAERLYRQIEPVFSQWGWQVELNTGRTSKTRRTVSYSANLLIGTSTIDVGVDFQINFLLFESTSARTFIQRLGRLGRHDGYVDAQGDYQRFEQFLAIALLPDWVYEALFLGKFGNPALLTSEGSFSRQELTTAIEQAFPPVAEFEQYARKWGKFQASKILNGMNRTAVREQFASSAPLFRRRVQSTLGVQLDFKEYQALQKNHQHIWEEVLSFRGGDFLQCGVWDTTEPNPADQFKLVDFVQTIANYRLEWMGADAFLQRARTFGLDEKWFEKKAPIAYFKQLAVRDSYNPIRVRIHQDLYAWGDEKFQTVLELKGVRLNADFPESVAINHRIEMKCFVAILFKYQSPLELKRKLRLPLLFPMYEFESKDLVTGTIAFGRQALLLSCHFPFAKDHSAPGCIVT